MRQAALICLAFAASAAPRTARSTEAEVGRAAIQRFGCARCHTIPGFTVSAENSCVGCHQKLATLPRTGLRRAPRARHYLQVPDLARVARRLRSDYLARYIADPHDARPHLEETMPRQQVSDADAGAIVAYLLEAAPSAEPAAASPRPAS